jgi:hypothetical protein
MVSNFSDDGFEPILAVCLHEWTPLFDRKYFDEFSAV